MSKITIDPSTPVCIIVNGKNPLASHLSELISAMGITVVNLEENQIDSASLQNAVYLIWFSDTAPAYADALPGYIDPDTTTVTKLLHIISLDRLYGTKTSLESENKKIVDAINKLHSFGHSSKLDVRVIGYVNAWDHRGLASADTVIPFLVNELRRANYPFSDSAAFHPVTAAAVAEAVVGYWFDRGHRDQTVVIRGQSMQSRDLQAELMKTHPELKHEKQDVVWGAGEGIGENEIKEVSVNPGDFIRYLESQINTATAAPPSPTAKPLPKVPRIVDNLPPAEPETGHHAAPVRFETVVVTDDALGTEPVRQNVQNETVIQPKTLPLVKPSPPKIPAKPPEPVSGHAKVTSRTVAKTATRPEKISRWVKLALGVVGIVFLALTIPFMLLYYRINAAWAVTPKSAGDTIERQSNGLDAAENFVDSMTGWLSFVPPYNTLKNRLAADVDGAKKHLLLVQAEGQLVSAAKLMLTAAEGDPYEPLRTAKHTLDDLYVLASTATGSAGTGLHDIARTRQVVNVLPYLIPSDKKIVIMVMLQNNLELRPAGGFLGAVSLLTFDHGKLLTTDTRDIYDLDNNLKGQVTPPADLKTYLGEQSWYFRDSNWSPDFVGSAGTANWFLEKEWGTPADVVVGVNLNTIKTILQATGPLTLPDGQVISADNLLATAFNHQDSPVSKPGSQKQEFLSMFVKPLMDKAIQGNPDQTAALLKAIGTAADHNELTVVAGNKASLSGLADLGWTGAVINPVCPVNNTDPCVTDMFYSAEANVGINKANFYLTRTHIHEITLSNTEARHSLRIDYNNPSPNDTWPAGSYKAYVRTYLPPNAADITVTVDNKQLASPDITITPGAANQTVSYAIEVKPLSKLTVNVAYSVPLASGFNSYVFAWQKQPGSSQDPVSLTINPPPARAVIRTSPNITAVNPPGYSGTLDKNLVFSLDFSL